MAPVLKRTGIVIIALVVMAGVFYGYAAYRLDRALETTYPVPGWTISDEVSKADLALGKRIVTVRNGCTECHGDDLSGKFVANDPAMGQIPSANITPYALKHRSDKDIALAIRDGLRPGGTSLRFMPSYEFQNLSKGDLAAAIAYLRTVPPVDKASPAMKIGPVAKILFALDKIPLLVPAASMDHQAGFIDKPAETASREFGAYLVNSACIGCHGNELRGGPVPGGPPDWPPAPSLRFKGNTIWSQQAFANTLNNGVSTITGKNLRLPMKALAGKLNALEIEAIWLYLSSLQS